MTEEGRIRWRGAGGTPCAYCREPIIWMAGNMGKVVPVNADSVEEGTLDMSGVDNFGRPVPLFSEALGHVRHRCQRRK